MSSAVAKAPVSEEVIVKREAATQAGYAPQAEPGVLSNLLTQAKQLGERLAVQARYTKSGDTNEIAVQKAVQYQGYIEKGDSPAVAVTRIDLPNMTSGQMLDALQESSPQLGGVVDKLRQHEGLAESIRVAAIQDPSILTGFEKLAQPDQSSIDLAKFETSLDDPQNVRKSCGRHCQ